MKKPILLLRVASYVMVIAGLIAGLIPLSSANAIGPSGLDPDEFGNNASYTVSDTCNVKGAKDLSVPIYFSQDPGTVTVQISVTGTTGAGEVQINGGTKISSGTKNITIAGFTQDSSTNMYGSDFKAHLTSPGWNGSDCNPGTAISFRLNLGSNTNHVAQGVIGYSSGNSEAFAVANQGRCELPPSGDRTGCGLYYNYKLPFAPPCSQVSSSARITVYDADNNQTTGTSPENSQPSPFTIRIYDITKRAYVKSSPLSVNRSTNGHYQYDGGNGTNGNGYFDNTTSMGNGETAYRNFNFVQGDKYQLELDHVYTNNVLQFKLPFDSIYSQITCYSYNLTPTSSTTATKAIPGAVVQLNGSIENGGQPDVGVTTNSKKPTSYSYLHMAYGKNATIPTDLVTLGATGAINCSNYASRSGRAGTCQAGSSGSIANGVRANTTASSSTGNFAKDSITIPLNAQVGSRYCSVLVVSPASANVPGTIINNARASIPACVTVMASPIKPMVRVMGYDARISGKVSTSLTIQGSGTTGSWSEYGVLSGSSNSNFASNRGLDGGSLSSEQKDWSTLTFANTATTGNCSAIKFGCYNTIPYPTALVTALRARCGANANANIGAIANYTATRFICVNGTATIKGNITLKDTSVSNPTKLPQVVIIANNIVIDPGVTRVDAWLVAGTNAAGGNISTCSSAKIGTNYFPAFNASGLNLGTASGAVNCPNALTVNGPVVASKLYLYRSTNPGTTGAPAETFNTRADAFLWAYGGGGASGTPYAQTTSVQELPPRF